jgi:ATP-dependent exoDNAse (exonuclease V) alpha subunit
MGITSRDAPDSHPRGPSSRSKLIDGARQLPTHHVTIRVPWHDGGWNGTTCRNPLGNSSCLVLGRINETRDDPQEVRCAGRAVADLQEGEWPPCVDEHATILQPASLVRTKRHPYAESSAASHGHMVETPLEIPAFGASCVPFRWMLTESAAERAAELGLGYRPDHEPDLKFKGGVDWLQEHDNQRVFLDTFFGAIQPASSLCFFYAKRTPLSDSPRRVIVGVGRVTRVGPPTEYRYSTPDPTLRSSLWERSIFHSIRPGFTDGFVLPYQELLTRAEIDPAVQLEDLVAFAPDEHFESFSYGTEHLTHDGAVASLLSLHGALERIAAVLPGPWAGLKIWVDQELNRLWKARGPFPGLGSALRAFGLPRGTLVAYAIARAQEQAPEKPETDSWDVFDRLVETPNLLGSELAADLDSDRRQVWRALTPPRRALLKLLSRFAIDADQATRFFVSQERTKAGITVTDDQLLENAYLLCERSRHWPDPIPFEVVDRGLFPDPIVTSRLPVPAPSALSGSIDPRRLRAATIAVLERATAEGHTLLPTDWVIERVRGADWKPELPLTEDVLPIAEPSFAGEILRVDTATGHAFQLVRYADAKKIIAAEITARTGPRALPHAGPDDWRGVIDRTLGTNSAKDRVEQELEERAREEKAAALATAFRSRLAVVVGAAGTGKTTLLKMLLQMSEVQRKGVLLLAPTGKARVRLETATGRRGQGQTIAQFLLGLHRYDGKTGRYQARPGAPKCGDFATVVIDECSMLTEDQLSAVFDAMSKVERYILVGDPRQLPPIGAGRPFVDIVRQLAPEAVESSFPRCGPAYAELTIPRRQIGEGRDDVLLASWFTSGVGTPVADEVWSRIEAGDSANVRVVEWGSEADLTEKLVACLVDELKLAGPDDELGFEESIGGHRFKNSAHAFFSERNEKRGTPGAGAKAEAWQILSPIRATRVGVDAINRAVQGRFRAEMRNVAMNANRWRRKVPEPFGPGQIVYGDKVINVENRSGRRVYPKQAEASYVANGDIGVVVGQYKGPSAGYESSPWKLEVELATQLGVKFDFLKREFGEEKSPPLELAYALTVHKTQGSQFGTTFVILPNPCRLLSRELLYTALTRHQDRLVLLHQGPLRGTRKFGGEAWSDVATRITNLFRAPKPVEVLVEEKRKCFLEERLIHRCENGTTLVRSKSELVIADKLFARGVDFAYEQELKLSDGIVYPDFTIADPATGMTFYWEHLGLLSDPVYAARWERKLARYRANGIAPHGEPGGTAGTLLITRDQPNGGLDATQIAKLIDEVVRGG